MTTTRLTTLMLLLVLFLPAMSCAPPSSAPEGFPDPGTDTFALAARARTKSVGLGDAVPIDISIRYDASFGIERRDLETEFKLPLAWREEAKKLGFVLDGDAVDPDPVVTEAADGTLHVYVTIEVRPMRLGSLVLPAIQLEARKKDGDDVRTESRQVEIEVVGSLDENSGAEAEIDPALVADAPRGPLPWWWSVITAFVATLGAWLWMRRRRGPEPEFIAPRIPADREALARIRELERMLERGEIGGERLVVESSATLRRWLEQGLGQQSLARTTDEFLEDLRTTTRFTTAQQNRLQDFLRRCDLIKFAGQDPTLEECRDLLASVRAFVEETQSEMLDPEREAVAAGSSPATLLAPIGAAPFQDGASERVEQSFYQWQEELFGFAFADPVFLLFLLVVPLLIWLARRARPALGFASVEALDRLPSSRRGQLAWLPRALAILALVPLILACARPQTFERVKIDTEGIDILLTIDLSSSMAARDMAKDRRETRLDVVKRVAKDFVKARANDRIGLVSFARYPDLVCPSTLDHQALLRFLDPLKHKRVVQRRGDRGDVEDGTAIGAGLALSVDRLEDLESKSRVVILLSDGEETVGLIDPMTAAKLAKDAKIRVYTIGAGRGVRGPLGMVHRPDFSALKGIAKTTDGEFFQAGSEEALTKVFERIDELERTALEDPIFAVDERFWALLFAGFGLFALAGLLRLVVFVVLP